MTELIADNRFNECKVRKGKIRDVFVEGREMGKLLDTTHCTCENDYYNSINEPLVFEGKLTDPHYNSFANIQIYSPRLLEGKHIKVTIGRKADNSLSDKQENHKIRCFAGLSLEGITALPKSATDIDANEKLELTALQSKK